MMRNPKGEMKASLKKGAWSVEEDRKLIAYINRYGIWNWSHMPKFAGLLRSGKSCRLRWVNYLKPGLKKGSFSNEEEQRILHFHSLLGNRWSAIARELPGRSDNEVKNYWHTNLKNRMKYNQVHNESKQMDVNISQCCKSLNNLQEKDDLFQANEIFNGHGAGVEFTGETGSPEETDEDLQCFWRELYPLEDLEIGNLDQELMFLDNVFLDSIGSISDQTVPWSFYSNEYDITQTTI